MLDLDTHYDLVQKIVFSKFSGYALDAEDLVQEVCFKIHRQNLGDCSYDPSKGSVSHYVYMIASGIVKKAWYRSKNDPMRWAQDLSEEYQARAVGKSHFETVLCNTIEERLKEESEALADIFDMSLQGFSRREMARMTHYTEYQIRKGRSQLRELLRGEIADLN